MSRCLGSLNSNKDFRYHSRYRRSKITHFTFADDFFLFCHRDAKFVIAAWAQFQKFYNAFGLQVNKKKCAIYFTALSLYEEQYICELLQVPKGEIPFRYLGVPLSSKKLTIH